MAVRSHCRHGRKNEPLEQRWYAVKRKKKRVLPYSAVTYALSYLTSPGGSTERIYVYIGEIDTAVIKASQCVWINQ